MVDAVYPFRTEVGFSSLLSTVAEARFSPKAFQDDLAFLRPAHHLRPFVMTENRGH